MDRALTWNERVFFLRPLQDGGRIMFLAEKNVIKTIQKIQTSSLSLNLPKFQFLELAFLTCMYIVTLRIMRTLVVFLK